MVEALVQRLERMPNGEHVTPMPVGRKPDLREGALLDRRHRERRGDNGGAHERRCQSDAAVPGDQPEKQAHGRPCDDKRSPAGTDRLDDGAGGGHDR